VDPTLAALFGVIFSGLGFAAGTIALVYADKADNLSKTSNQTASDSMTKSGEPSCASVVLGTFS
jgi:hypothetical protein